LSASQVQTRAYTPADPDATRTLDLDATGQVRSAGRRFDQVPAVIGSYRRIRLLGAGGMGKVYEAEEIATGRRVALKLIAPENVSSADALIRFRREGRLAATLTHPRCVFVLRADEEAGQPYLVLELMPGKTLKDLVEKQGPLSVANAVAKMCDVMEGLGAMHQLGMIHRDVKPANCFLDADGRVKIGDFGLARALLRGDSNLTGTGVFVGTPLFASPE
jgi:serine/threonine protein kinase